MLRCMVAEPAEARRDAGPLQRGLPSRYSRRRRDVRQQALEEFLGAFVVSPWGRDAAAADGALRARQERLGKKLGPHDTQNDTEIAAHAVALGAVLVSYDSAIRRIPNLRVENWATDI